MLLKSILVFEIFNYMREIININMWKVYASYALLILLSGSVIYFSHLRKVTAQ